MNGVADAMAAAIVGATVEALPRLVAAARQANVPAPVVAAAGAAFLVSPSIVLAVVFFLWGEALKPLVRSLWRRHVSYEYMQRRRRRLYRRARARGADKVRQRLMAADSGSGRKLKRP